MAERHNRKFTEDVISRTLHDVDMNKTSKWPTVAKLGRTDVGEKAPTNKAQYFAVKCYFIPRGRRDLVIHSRQTRTRYFWHYEIMIEEKSLRRVQVSCSTNVSSISAYTLMKDFPRNVRVPNASVLIFNSVLFMSQNGNYFKWCQVSPEV